MDNIWIAILSSATVAAIISALANLWMYKRKYKDDYFKMVVNKRIEAYALVEDVYKILKTKVSDDLGKTAFSIIFSDKEFLNKFHKKLYDAMSNNVWLSNDINDDLQYFNSMLLLSHKAINETGIDIQTLGKQKNSIFTEIYTNIEKHYTKDMLSLHDVEGFLKSKNKKDK